MELSVVLPAYNEADKLESAVERTAEELKKITPSFEILIAEDGSTDGTDEIASALAKKYDYIKHLHSEERLGRGRALTRAFKSANGEIFVYLDVDLATDMTYLKQLTGAVQKGYDISTGSRMLPESMVKRSFRRGMASKGFNFLTKLFLRSKIHDHQCGFKAFRRDVLLSLIDQVKDQHWFWDTEILVRAQRQGYRIKEFPVRWERGGATKVDLIHDVFEMGSQILRLWWELRRDRT